MNLSSQLFNKINIKLTPKVSYAIVLFIATLYVTAQYTKNFNILTILTSLMIIFILINKNIWIGKRGIRKQIGKILFYGFNIFYSILIVSFLIGGLTL